MKHFFNFFPKITEYHHKTLFVYPNLTD